MSIQGYPVIDAHTHITPIEMMKPAPLAVWWKTYPKTGDEITRILQDPHKLLAHLDREGIDKVVGINYVSRELFGFDESVHDYIVEMSRHAPDRLLPCGGVDAAYSTDPVRDIEDLIFRRRMGLIKIHGPHCGFAPDDYLRDKPALAGVYGLCEREGVPVMFHTGTSVFPGARSRYGNPMAIDDIAIDFPKLTIIMAHGGRPLWMAEAFFLMRRHANVHMDVSGIPPKLLLQYFPRIEEIADKTLYGSDWPSPGIPGMRLNAEAIIALPLSEESKRKILYENAERLLFRPYAARR